MNNRAETVLVLGMHRSGTSAVAGVARLLGATPPAATIPAGHDNPSGFWESWNVLGVNDWILHEHRATWYECLGFDANALDMRTRAAAITLIMLCLTADFASAPLPLIKDPRICLLLDLWLPALRARSVSPAVLLVVRSPDEVARSLAARDRLPAAISGALWLRHMLDAEYASRGCRRQILAYDALLRDWRTVLTPPGRPGAIVWPVDPHAVAPQIDRFLDARLRHFGPVAQRQVADDVPFAGLLEEAHAALRGLEQNAADQAQLLRLDHVRTAFRSWCGAHGRGWADALLDRHEIRRSLRFDVRLDWLRIARAIPNSVRLPIA